MMTRSSTLVVCATLLRLQPTTSLFVIPELDFSTKLDSIEMYLPVPWPP